MGDYINQDFALHFKGNSFLLLRKLQAFNSIEEGFSIGFWAEWRQPDLREESCITKDEHGEVQLTTSAQSAFLLSYNYPEETEEERTSFFTISVPDNLTIHTKEGRFETGIQLEKNKWYFLMFTFQASEAGRYVLKTYVDGIASEKTMDISFGPEGLLAQKRLGIACPFSSGGKKNRWKGGITELQIWQSVLSPEKIAQLREAMPLVKDEPKLALFLPISMAENNGSFNDPFHSKVEGAFKGLRVLGF